MFTHPETEKHKNSMQHYPYCTRSSNGNKLISREELEFIWPYLPQTNNIFQLLSRMSYSFDINLHHLEDEYVLMHCENS